MNKVILENSINDKLLTKPRLRGKILCYATELLAKSYKKSNTNLDSALRGQ